MIKDKIDDYCSTIDTHKYERIKTIFKFVPAGLLVGDMCLSSVYPEAHSIMAPMFYTSIVPCTCLSCYKGKDYTTDVKELRKEYDEFIKKYNELNKMFNLKDPYEIQRLYCHLYEDGYLSKDKEFEFLNRKHKDITSILGTEVINGRGVCRHISAMLSDILNDYGIFSSRLGVYLHNYYADPKESKNDNMSKEDLEKWAHEYLVDEDRLESFLWSIRNFEGNNYGVIFEDDAKTNPISVLLGNHAISYACYDGKSYFLDPTQKSFYRRSDKDGALYNWFNKVDIKHGKVECDKERFNKAMELINSNLPSIDREEEKNIRRNIEKLYNDNLDVFESFYKDNKETYEDISCKLLKLK